MEKVLVIADSRSYIQNNCFQKQLHESIKINIKNFKIEYFYLEPKTLQSLQILKNRSKTFSFVISTLRQRVLFNNIKLIRKIVGDIPLKVYDQDPWNNYIDNSKTYDCYNIINSNFNLLNLFVTSSYWANYISINDKLPSTFVKMGMLPRLCNSGLPLLRRSMSVEFRGSLYPHREEAFSAIRKSGQNIKINSELLKYPEYLQYLRKLSIFIHDESGYWKCKGEKIPMSTGMWVKDIEIASQGCFSLRNYHEDYETYSIENIPLIRFYKNPSEVKNIVEEIFSFSTEYARDIQSASVDFIINTNNWKDTANTIFNT
jgi:hypothetical protein